MPEKIPVSILTGGIQDLKLIKEWGDYLAKDEGFGRDKVGKLSTSQIRKFFGSIFIFSGSTRIWKTIFFTSEHNWSVKFGKSC